jgi:glycosyltransferase involved in cell wall biosynthesis
MKDPRIAFVLVSAVASGTERRMAFVYRHLSRKHPGRYRLLLTPHLFEVLNRGGYALDRVPGVQLLPAPHPFDRKQSADTGPVRNLARLISLAGYRKSMKDLARQGEVDVFQIYLEMVPFLGLFPLPGIPTITSLVSHIPKYFDRRTAACQLLLRATRQSLKTDCVYSYVADRLCRAGAEASKLNFPYRNTVNHEAFFPEHKELMVSFTARSMRYKNPHVMLGVVDKLLTAHPTVRIFLHGGGPMLKGLSRSVQSRGWSEQVVTGYIPDPSVVVNRSLVHVSVEEYDNSPNQSLLEGMAAGCAVVASDVGLTAEVVTPDVGRLTSLDPGDIAEAIIALLDRPSEAVALGLAARQRILRDHHIDIYLNYLEQLHDLEDPRPIIAGARAPATR